ATTARAAKASGVKTSSTHSRVHPGVHGATGAGALDNRHRSQPFFDFDDRGDFESSGIVVIVLFEVLVAKEVLKTSAEGPAAEAAAGGAAKTTGTAPHTAFFAAAHHAPAHASPHA